MTVVVSLLRVNPDSSTTTLGSLTCSSTALIPILFNVMDYPATPGVYQYYLRATSPDSDTVVFSNVNLSGIWLRR